MMKNQQGITLIETIVAIAILSIAIFAIINIFPKGIQIIKTAERNTVAAFLAQEKIEELESLPYGDIPIGTIEEKQKMSNDPDNPFYYYQRETEIIYVDPDNGLAQSQTDLGIKQIKTTIYWFATTDNQEKTLSIYALRSQR
ncbi:MAG: type II secretion system protein [bacterium]